MRTLAASAYYSYLGVFRWVRPATYISQKIVFALAQMTFFVLVGRAVGNQDVTFYVVGNAMILTATSTVYALGMTVGGERQQGLLPYLIGSPADDAAIFFGHALVQVIDGVVAVLIGLGWGVLIFGVGIPVQDLPALLAAIFVASLACAGLGLVVGAAALIVLDASFVGNAMTFALLLLSGANFETSDLPEPLRSLSGVVPLARSLSYTRDLLAGAEPRLELLLGDAALGAMYGLAGYAVFRAVATAARRDGGLDRA